jgi:hypothetical protein
MYGTITPEKAEIPFNSDMFRNILKENKDLESGHIFLSYQGLMKLQFNSEDTLSVYYMVRREESAF